tara:strand:+ start:396 stop:1433 length:1038 start_codon:yes stop_codon:yes gene_type:complete
MKKINFFLEDPGSSNFILGIRKALNKNKIIVKVYAQDFAKNYLKGYEEQVDDFSLKNKNIFECDLLVIGTTENKKTKSKLLFEKAKKKKILTGLIIDAPTGLDQDFFINTLNKTKKLIDFIFTADSRTVKVLTENNVDVRKIMKVTNPKFEYIQNYVKNNYKSEGKKKIAFLGELSGGLNNEEFIKNDEYNLHGYSGSKKRTEIVFEEFITAMKDFRKEGEIFLRLHPKEKKSSYKKYFGCIDQFSFKENSINFINRMDLIVGMTTNLISEARVLGKECLSILPRDKEINWINSDILPFINVARDANDIKKFFRKFFSKQYSLNDHTVKLKKNSFSDLLIKIVYG